MRGWMGNFIRSDLRDLRYAVAYLAVGLGGSKSLVPHQSNRAVGNSNKAFSFFSSVPYQTRQSRYTTDVMFQ